MTSFRLGKILEKRMMDKNHKKRLLLFLLVKKIYLSFTLINVFKSFSNKKKGKAH